MNLNGELEQEINRQKAITQEVLKRFNDSCKEIQCLAIEYVNKWLLSNRIQKEKNNGVKLASQPQKDLMKKLKIDFDPNITMKEASKLISQKLESD